MSTVAFETVLYEEPGWALHPVVADSEARGDCNNSILWHVCTQRVDTQSAGRYKGQRVWVDDRSKYYTCGRASSMSINTPCWRCGLGPSQELQGLWRLHNWDYIGQ